MITRDEFPYLQELIINDAYAVKNLRVPVFELGKSFKHLILTGRNGSGKTTIIKSVAAKVQFDITSADKHKYQIRNIQHWIEGSTNINQVEVYNNELAELEATETLFYQIGNNLSDVFPSIKGTLVAYFPAQRVANVQRVTSPTIEDSYVASIEKPKGVADFANYFKQYLVNKKVSQALAQIEGNFEKAQEQEQFFKELEKTFGDVFSDNNLKLTFISESYEFLIHLSDGRKITFNQLSAGFSALLSILMDLLMRTDLLRKQANDYTYDPCGFVLIDEPETHLHLEMQYQILPLLTNLFPNLQFIVATHSPAVASSIKNATVFDLSTGEAMGDEAAGSSFSELMQTHFGVENEYSNVGDAILDDIKEIVKIADHAVAREKLVQLLEEKGKYMSDGLKLEVEAQLIGLE